MTSKFFGLLPRDPDAPRQQRLAHVIRVREVQNRITQQHHQLLMLAPKQPRQRLIARLHHDALSHPLPELRLRRPKLLPIATDHERRFLFPLLFLRNYVWLCRHQCTLHPLRVAREDTQVPEREASLRGGN